MLKNEHQFFKKTYLFFVAVPFVVFFAFGNINGIHPQNKKPKKVNEKNIVVLQTDKDLEWIYDDDEKPATLNKNDFKIIERLLQKTVQEYNRQVEARFQHYKKKNPQAVKVHKNNFLIELERYKRQYFATQKSNGEKIVWINCFCRIPSNIDWQTDLVWVKDGGNCYFQMQINITKKEVESFSVNGAA